MMGSNYHTLILHHLVTSHSVGAPHVNEWNVFSAVAAHPSHGYFGALLLAGLRTGATPWSAATRTNISPNGADCGRQQ